MRGTTAALVLACSLIAGCYESSGLGDDGGSGRDAGGASDGASSDASVPLDAGPCVVASGAQLCNTGVCPLERCACLPPAPGREGVCVTWGERSYVPGGIEQPCAPGRAVVAHDGGSMEMCSDLAACVEMHLRDAYQRAGFACVYADGTPVETGVVLSEPCPGLEDVACGPACASCGAGRACLGPSESSGLGVCVPFADDGYYASFDREWCGMGLVETHACSAGNRCLRFATPSVITPPIAGTCVPSDACTRLASARPDRFACE